MQKDPDMTAGNLIKMYKFARDRGITPVGVTLPGTAHVFLTKLLLFLY